MDTLDMLIFYSFNLGIFTLVFFIAGMIKPKWPLFFMNEPTRFLVVAITTVMIMVVLTMYGEGNRKIRAEQARLERSKMVGTSQEPETPSPSEVKPQKTKPKKQAAQEDELPQFDSVQDAIKAFEEQQ